MKGNIYIGYEAKSDSINNIGTIAFYLPGTGTMIACIYEWIVKGRV
jgi:hypothetical protein